jgi:hypothetical protein
MRTLLDHRRFLALSTLTALSACSPTSDSIDVGASAGTGGAASGAGGQSGATASTTGSGFGSGGQGTGGAEACVADQQEATLVKEPVDLIVVVDTSSTMQPASDAVEANINQNLAAALTAGGIDYRMVVLADYGNGASLCIGPPLAGVPCSPLPPKPANTPSFYHYDQGTGSGAFLSSILAWYSQPDGSGAAPNGYKDWLRPGVKKVFLAFSDTSSASSNASNGDSFDTELLALDPTMFGTAAKRNYTFHSIIGLRENNPATTPWLATDPLVSQECTGLAISLGSGESLQQVSILSGGLRFPVCETDSYDVVFQKIAADVVQKAQLACELPFPEPPPGETLDPNTIQLVYTDGSGQTSTFVQVADAAACNPGSFFVENETIVLCPATCDLVRADDTGKIDVTFGCDVGFAQ